MVLMRMAKQLSFESRKDLQIHADIALS